MKKITEEQESLQNLISLVFGKSGSELSSTAARMRRAIYTGGLVASLGLAATISLILVNG